MFSILYQVGFIVSISSLIAWFYFQDKAQISSFARLLFFGGFLSYLFSIGMVEASTEQKLWVLCRDLVVMGIVSQFFNLVKNNGLLFFGLLAGFYGLFATKGVTYLEQSFSSIPELVSEMEVVQLDKSGELLVEIASPHYIEDIQSVLDQYNISIKKAFTPVSEDITTLDDYYVLDIPAVYVSQLETIKKELKNTARLNWLEENEIIQISPMETVPVATSKGKKKYGINDPAIDQLWGFEAMNVDQLYKGLSKTKIKPKKKALIAILDTGVDAKHEDLAANYVSTKPASDTDKRGHGTHCAGIAAAVSNNGIGVASFSNNNQFAKVTSIQVLSDFGMGSQKTIIDGMLLAADKGADVISMSLGGLANSLKQKAYEDAVKYCNKKGSIVVVAAGNSNKDARNYSPANLKGVITVSAIDQDLNRATFSNYVTHIKWGVTAPGVGIYSTIPDNKYASFNGTSMATPYVSGLVGVLKSIQPDLTTKQVYAILNESGKNTNATKETGRLIQPAKALELVID